MDKLTELDATVLAMVAREGPMSAYEVRKRFAVSTTPSFSSSTGSIYPSVRRLVAARLLSASGAKGGRNVQMLTATPLGRRSVVAWLCEFDVGLAAATPDPIRTRTFSLSLLDSAGRDDFFRRALVGTEAAIRHFEERVKLERAEGMAELEVLAGYGALYQLEARRAWLVQLREAWERAGQPNPLNPP